MYYIKELRKLWKDTVPQSRNVTNRIINHLPGIVLGVGDKLIRFTSERSDLVRAQEERKTWKEDQVSGKASPRDHIQESLLSLALACARQPHMAHPCPKSQPGTHCIPASNVQSHSESLPCLFLFSAVYLLEN